VKRNVDGLLAFFSTSLPYAVLPHFTAIFYAQIMYLPQFYKMRIKINTKHLGLASYANATPVLELIL